MTEKRKKEDDLKEAQIRLIDKSGQSFKLRIVNDGKNFEKKLIETLKKKVF